MGPSRSLRGRRSGERLGWAAKTRGVACRWQSAWVGIDAKNFSRSSLRVRPPFPPLRPDGGKAGGGATCAASSQASVLRGICWGARRLRRNIRAPLVTASKRTPQPPVLFLLSLTSIVTVHHVAVCLGQNLANRQRRDGQQACPANHAAA